MIINRVATFREIDEYWNINIVMDANEALDIEEEAKAFYMKRQDATN